MTGTPAPSCAITPAITPAPLSAFLDAQGITVSTYAHAPVFTVDEGRDIKDALPGGHTKNLFLKDKKGTIVLVTAIEDTAIDLKWLNKRLSCDRFSFGKPELLLDMLGVTPGSVTPFALLAARGKEMRFVLDARTFDHDLVHYHPSRNDMTTVITPDDLVRFATACGFPPVVIDFAKG